ncbi:MAG: tetratricopeptide repeat protein [Desulfatibacillum sp.]|nr:tetratricopeptide repeat protein [Desulfatibacillum sp.]
MKPDIDIYAVEEDLQRGKADLDSLFALGDMYFSQGRHLDLLDLCNRMTTMPLTKLDLATVLSYKGVTHVCLSHWEAATAAFLQSLDALEHAPENMEEVVSLKGMNYYDLSLYCQDVDKADDYGELALKYLTILSRSFPDYPHMSKVFAHIADLHHSMGDLDQALVYYGLFYEASVETEDKVWAMTGMATVYGFLGQTDKALEMYNDALQVADSKALMSKVYYDLGEMHYRLENFYESRSSLETALKFRDQDPVLMQNEEYEVSILWRLGTIAFDLEEEEEMAPLFEKVLGMINSTHSYYADINLRMGHYYLGLCRYATASGYYNEVLLTPAASAEETLIAKDCLAGIPLKKPTLLH